jgi:DNA helicase-2/ATP-dependent DNA helicase PcrA
MTQNNSYAGVVLNETQMASIVYDKGPQLVFAGAGTGKTRVLTTKIAWLIKEKEIFPNHIFAATFTNKAAREMRDRVEETIGVPCDGLWIGTFHSLCVRILRREASAIGYTPSFSIYDQSDQKRCIRKVLEKLQISERVLTPKQALGAISHYKSRCIRPQDIPSPDELSFYQARLLDVYREYNTMLQQQQAMDFDDLITNTVFLLRGHREVLSSYQRQFRYVLVDEYQDTNAAQFCLVELLSSAHHNIFVVGDDDQSIYGWRGANIENILTFEKVFPEAKVFTLEQNYRSGQQILDFANAVICGNTNRAPKRLRAEGAGQASVSLSRFYDDRQEAQAVCEQVRRILSQGGRAGDIGVLFRTNAQSRVLEDAFRRQNIPYVLIGTTSFYERKEIKDCLAYLRLLVNPSDDISCERIINVPARSIGKKSVEAIEKSASLHTCSLLHVIMHHEPEGLGAKARKGLAQLRELFGRGMKMKQDSASAQELLEEILRLSGYVDMLQQEDSEESQARLENINELVNSMAVWQQQHPDGTLDAFIEEISLLTSVDRSAMGDEAVNCMTLHCAKGLEFSHVFLVGLEDGLIPSRFNFEDAERLEEERRLLYVGITRAKRAFYGSYVEKRRRFGRVSYMLPSRYIEEIPVQLYTFHDRTGTGPMPGAARTARARWDSEDTSASRNVRPADTGSRSVSAGHGTRAKETPRGSGTRADRAAMSTGRDQGRAHTPKTRTPAAGTRSSSQHAGHAQADADAAAFSQENVSFTPGQQVRHATYGNGKVLSVHGFGKDLRLSVRFGDGKLRKLMAYYANLERI